MGHVLWNSINGGSLEIMLGSLKQVNKFWKILKKSQEKKGKMIYFKNSVHAAEIQPLWFSRYNKQTWLNINVNYANCLFPTCIMHHSPLNPTFSSVSLLQITAVRTESLVVGGIAV